MRDVASVLSERDTRVVTALMQGTRSCRVDAGPHRGRIAELTGRHGWSTAGRNASPFHPQLRISRGPDHAKTDACGSSVHATKCWSGFGAACYGVSAGILKYESSHRTLNPILSRVVVEITVPFWRWFSRNGTTTVHRSIIRELGDVRYGPAGSHRNADLFSRPVAVSSNSPERGHLSSSLSGGRRLSMSSFRPADLVLLLVVDEHAVELRVPIA